MTNAWIKFKSFTVRCKCSIFWRKQITHFFRFLKSGHILDAVEMQNRPSFSQREYNALIVLLSDDVWGWREQLRQRIFPFRSVPSHHYFLWSWCFFNFDKIWLKYFFQVFWLRHDFFEQQTLKLQKKFWQLQGRARSW